VATLLAGCGSLAPRASTIRSADHSSGATSEKAVLTAMFGSLPTLAPPPNLPADCIPSSAPPQIQLGAYATFSGNLIIDAPRGGQMVAAHITGTLCGIGVVINAPSPPFCPAGTPAGVQLNIPADGETFNLVPSQSVELTMIPGFTITVSHTQINPTPISAVVCAGAGAPGPLEAPCYIPPGHPAPCSPLSISASASASLLGADCVLGVTVPIRGSIYGPLTGFTVDFANEPFSIGLPKPTTLCPLYVTNAIGSLLQFPLNSAGGYEGLTPGLAHINITGNGVAYYPSS
jgi:hypothetical protein